MPVKAEYSLDESVDRMYELGEYAYLWDGHLKEGTGGQSNTDRNPNSFTPEQLLADKVLLERLEKENPELVKSIFESSGA